MIWFVESTDPEAPTTSSEIPCWSQCGSLRQRSFSPLISAVVRASFSNAGPGESAIAPWEPHASLNGRRHVRDDVSFVQRRYVHVRTESLDRRQRVALEHALGYEAERILLIHGGDANAEQRSRRRLIVHGVLELDPEPDEVR